jgi:hypothetical protein
MLQAVQTRLARYAALSDTLARLTGAELAALVAQAPLLHTGVGGRSVLLTIDATPIFVKQLPLTDLERQPEHVRSTANLFDIPLSCHYGLGGPGFSAWRELAANVLANGWVLSGACVNFPLLYHWRVLPSDQQAEAGGDVGFWTESAAVRARLDAIHDASAQVALFCEYMPQNLLEWLTERVGAGAEAAETAIAFVDAHLAPTIDFMNTQGLIHFDTHFENITTDGRNLCFGDFGLALSSDFALTRDEIEFLARHRQYDHGRAAVGYVHCLSAAYFGKDRWKENLRGFLKTAQPSVPPAVASAIQRQAPLALAFLEFSRRLQEEDKQTRYSAGPYGH